MQNACTVRTSRPASIIVSLNGIAHEAGVCAKTGKKRSNAIDAIERVGTRKSLTGLSGLCWDCD